MRVRSLEWDDTNLAHLAEREITREDVESVCGERVSPLVRIARSGRGERKRFLVVGQNAGGEFVTVVLKPRGGDQYRPITAWVSMPDERRRARRERK